MNKPHKLITIRDIADRAGVSSATVSRAVNHRLKVSTETYKRITTAMEELGYVLPESPGHLVGDPNNRFVLLNIPQMGNPVFVDYVEGVSASAKKHNWHVLISTDRIVRKTQNTILEMLQSCHSAGIISMNVCDPESLLFLNKHLPVVQCMERNPDLDIPYICVDDYSASMVAVEYLIRTGRRNIGVIHSTTMRTSLDRCNGYQEAMRRHGLSPDPSLNLHIDTMRSSMMRTIFKQCISNFQTVPDAFFCTSDQVANAALIALTEFGYRVPDDVALIGFDNSDVCELSTPRISTVSYSKYEAGYMACEMLYEKFTNPDAVLRSLTLETQLVIRQTT